MLKQRIEILTNAKMISKEVSDYMIRVIDYLESFSYFEQSKLEMFTTHLAMSTQRIVNDEAVNVIEESIMAQVREDENYDKATTMYLNVIQDAPVSFPDSEKDFILMHLCNLLQSKISE